MDVTIKTHAHAKRISITVRRDGSIAVTKPRRVSDRAARDFVTRSAGWIARAQAKLKPQKNTSRIEPSAQEYKKYKKAALALAEHRTSYFAARYGVSIQGLSVRNQKSRWGSCSRRKTLSFNYRIIFLPQALAEYVIVHEVCHLREMNHGKRFWALVAQEIPDYSARRAAIRKLERRLLVD